MMELFLLFKFSSYDVYLYASICIFYLYDDKYLKTFTEGWYLGGACRRHDVKKKKKVLFTAH